MKFVFKPILSEIKELYEKPINQSRFVEYLDLLQGNSNGELALPIAGFNPMAKEHILQKIHELESFKAEEIIEDTIQSFNSDIKDSTQITITTVLNLADDKKGKWTNFYSTDFESKFNIYGIVSRNFCVPYFYTSETFTEVSLRVTAREYLSRTLYRKTHPQPITLEDYLNQEVFVANMNIEGRKFINTDELEEIDVHYALNKLSEEYPLIFNFFYGDVGSQSLGYKEYGIKSFTGFDYSQSIAIGKGSSLSQ